MWIIWARTSRQDQERPCSPGFPGRLGAPKPSCAVSQTSAARFLSVQQEKEVEWKKNPSSSHCGHTAREESSRPGARRPQSGIFVVSFLLAAVGGARRRDWSLLSHTSRPKHHEEGGTLFPPPSLCPSAHRSDCLHGLRGRGTSPFQERRRIWRHQQSGSPLLLTLPPAPAHNHGLNQGRG